MGADVAHAISGQEPLRVRVSAKFPSLCHGDRRHATWWLCSAAFTAHYGSRTLVVATQVSSLTKDTWIIFFCLVIFHFHFFFFVVIYSLKMAAKTSGIIFIFKIGRLGKVELEWFTLPRMEKKLILGSFKKSSYCCFDSRTGLKGFYLLGGKSRKWV